MDLLVRQIRAKGLKVELELNFSSEGFSGVLSIFPFNEGFYIL